MRVRNVIQDWKTYRDNISYIANLVDIAGHTPVRWYVNSGDPITTAIIEGDNIDFIFTTSSEPEVKVMRENLDLKTFDNLPDGRYAYDYRIGMVLAGEGWDKSSLFSYFPPNIGNTELVATNFFAITKDGNWFRSYGRAASFPHVLFSLDWINKFSILTDNNQSSTFGMELMLEYLKSRYKLQTPTKLEIEHLSKYYLPTGVERDASYDALTTMYVDLFDSYEGEYDEEDMEEQTSIVALKDIVDNGFNFHSVNLSTLLGMKEAPMAGTVNMDFHIDGIHKVTVTSTKQILIYYDGNRIVPTDIAEFFGGFNLDDLIMIDDSEDDSTNSKFCCG